MIQFVKLFLFSSVLLWGFALQAAELPLQVRQITPINFGKFTVAKPGSLKLTARDGNCVASGGVVRMNSVCESAQFEISGLPGRRVMVQPPAMVEMVAGGNTRLSVTGLTVFPESMLTLGADGKARVWVGGTLLLTAMNVTPAHYSGFFAISAEYLP